MGNCQDGKVGQDFSEDQMSNEINQKENQNSNFLKVTGITWSKDSHGLFDYETQEIEKNQLNINSSGRIVRKNHKIIFQKEDQVQNEDEEILLNLELDDDGIFWIKSYQNCNIKNNDNQKFRNNEQESQQNNNQDDSQKQWTIVKRFPNESGYMLRGSDIIKLGRINFLIKELELDPNWHKKKTEKKKYAAMEKKSTNMQEMDITEIQTEFDEQCNHVNSNFDFNLIKKTKQACEQQLNDQQENLQNDNNTSQNLSNSNCNTKIKKNHNINNEQNDQKICRICLSDEIDQDENIMVNPCKCQGTMKNIHIQCLMTWIKSKSIINNGQNQNNNNNGTNNNNQNSKVFCFPNNFECELCKTSYPYKFQSEGFNYDVRQIARPVGQPYVGIQILQGNQNKSNHQGFYMIYLQKGKPQKFNIGRSHESEIRVTDISVSRSHACLNWNGSHLFLLDKQSKFGSLVQLNQEIPLTRDMDGFSIQCGRTTLQFNFSAKQGMCNLFDCCYKNQEKTTQTQQDEDVDV